VAVLAAWPHETHRLPPQRPAACATARRSSTSACRPVSCLPPATPKPRSPASSASPGRTSAAGTTAWRHGGLEALRSAGPTGPDPRLSPAQLTAIDQALRQGACAHGFDTDHWTLARITIVIEQATGVGYHPGHTWKLLRRMGWRLQRPARRAVERDEQAIARWVAEDWP
jgi:transposase